MVETDGRGGGSRQRLSAGLHTLVRGSAFLGLAMAGLALLVVPLLVPGLAVLGVVAMVGLPPSHGLVLALVLWAGDLLVVRYGVLVALLGTRRLAKLARRLSDEWLGLPIPESYLRARSRRQDVDARSGCGGWCRILPPGETFSGW